MLATVAVAGAAYTIAPLVVADHVRSRLVAHGFPEASVGGVGIGLRHLELRDVHLADDVDVDSVRLDRGLSLLWRDPDAVAIAGARATPTALARLRERKTTRSSTREKPAELDVSIEVRDPSPKGFRATARGHVSIGDDVKLRDGHVELTVPSGKQGGVAVTSAVLSARVAGNLSTLDLEGTAQLAASRIELGSVTLTDAKLALRAHGSEITVRADGVRLEQLLAGSPRVTGSGIVDGTLTVQRRAGDWQLSRADLRARAPGTLRLTDPALREQIAKSQAPFAVHAAIATALGDFRFASLSARLEAADKLTVAMRGRGRRNQQELDMKINVRGAGTLTSRILGGAR